MPTKAEYREKLVAKAQTILDQGLQSSWSGNREDEEKLMVSISVRDINTIRSIIRKLGNA